MADTVSHILSCSQLLVSNIRHEPLAESTLLSTMTHCEQIPKSVLTVIFSRSPRYPKENIENQSRSVREPLSWMQMVLSLKPITGSTKLQLRSIQRVCRPFYRRIHAQSHSSSSI